MDIFTEFNLNKIKDRQIDTLIGLSKGIVADGKVEQAEAEFLQTWLVQSRSASDNPIIVNLLDRVSIMLEDGVLDREESSELLSVLKRISGDESYLGEVAKATRLPIIEPMPPITFQGRSFLFSGTCALGTREQCEEATVARGGKIAKNVTKSLDYLVIGTYVKDSWVHENFGRKIEKAMTYRNNGVPIVIITEQHWAQSVCM
ncbi:NAD-dependent DNA ligase [Hahella sp. KA22]|uniref:BRCT domain-containing protein n=1 Tax=Hahella sp. KA22 TaxID=1628392 RepID=UPI000FDCE956|nr:BRCT domain-containing protein [Hahella sp. KA22]AZZ91985.1 NAD-dependent DNA ligase [Hahella sp. KA22]QAY55356.1 NAD-dependent DNA ligase [Hahella sp. KA22]